MRAVTTVTLVALLALLLIPAVGLVSAQDADATPEPEVDNETTTVVTDVDEQLRVTSYSYDDDAGIMTIGLENHGDSRSVATVTEVISDRAAEGSGTFGVEQLRIQSGESVEVDVAVDRVDGTAAVMIVSQRSLERGTGAFVADQDASATSTFDGAPTWNDVRLGVGFGIVISLLVVLIAAWHVVRDSERSDYEEVTI